MLFRSLTLRFTEFVPESDLKFVAVTQPGGTGRGNRSSCFLFRRDSFLFLFGDSREGRAIARIRKNIASLHTASRSAGNDAYFSQEVLAPSTTTCLVGANSYNNL